VSSNSSTFVNLDYAQTNLTFETGVGVNPVIGVSRYNGLYLVETLIYLAQADYSYALEAVNDTVKLAGLTAPDTTFFLIVKWVHFL
jgi:hypothetical protein